VNKALFLLPAMALGLAAGLTSSRRQPPSPRHRILFDVSTGNAETWTRILNNVENAMRDLGTEETTIEVVAYGPGLGMLLAASAPDPERMERLSRGSVVFAACRNTMESRQLTPEALLGFAQVVPSGVAELVRKQEAGWSYLKPGS